MGTRRIILLLFAAVIAIAIAFTVFKQQSPKESPAATQAVVPTTEIAAAARDLPTGTILKESDLKWVTWAANADTSALLVKGQTTLADAAGAVVRDGFRAGEPIIAARIAHPHDQGFLAAVLNPGMRAMSISLTPTAEVAGFIFPGDRVDVILTHSFSRKDSPDLTERRISETLLRNVRVLALDQRSDNQTTDPKIAQIATLEVDEKQAEKLALAIDMASTSSSNKAELTLVLRSLASDDKNTADKKSLPTWDSDVSSAYPTVNGEDGLVQRVQVMRGKTITEDTFERHR
jgi:pilus assembly protein CpaB